VSGPQLTTGAVADLVGGVLHGEATVAIERAASLEEAGPGDLAFLASDAFREAARHSRAAALLVTPRLRDAAGPATRIVVADPRRAIVRVLDALTPPSAPTWGIHPTCRIGHGCRWSGRITIGAHAVIGPGVRLGHDCWIGAGVVIGRGARLGDACLVHDGASIAADTALGDRTTVKPGARVGTDGFAFIDDDGTHRRVPHRGACRIGADVEIGANVTIDRGSIGATEIGQGTKIDNLVHIAHNVRVGARCLILAQVGIAGTTDIGDDVAIGGQAGLAGQLRVGTGARLAAQSGVIGDVAAGATVSGYPARDHRSVLRQVAALARLTPLTSTLERVARDHANTD
jgi:UDP-3-O-[3-hydroxymyristoyl] glucosamine N-acyltransferase